MPSAPPKIRSAEVVAAQPNDADAAMLAQLSTEVNRRLPATVFIVKIRLDKPPESTGDGWALYVGDTRIPKYWEYPGGIYFKVLDQTFLAEHGGEPLRFSHDDQNFVKTGARLPALESPRRYAEKSTRPLPLQSEVLNDRISAKPAGEPSARKRVPRATARTRRVATTRKKAKSR